MNFIAAHIYYLIARTRRNKGRYNSKTSFYYKKACDYSNKELFHIDFARFQRDINGSIAPETLIVLKKWAPTSRNHTLQLLIRESELLTMPRLHSINESNSILDKIFLLQETWRNELTNYLYNKSIAVVGNGTTLLNSNLGKEIDVHNVVCRFNRYPSHSNIENDIGNKVDIWITSPDILNEGKNLPSSVQWVIVAGGDVRFTLKDWSGAKEHLSKNRKIITIPLCVWTTLVQRYQAPPSAGMLWITYLLTFKTTNKTINLFGFDKKKPKRKNYHIASTSYKPSSRHHWKAEKKHLATLSNTNKVNTYNAMKIGTFSLGLMNSQPLKRHLGNCDIYLKPSKADAKHIGLIIGWGRKKNTIKARDYAQHHNLPYTSLEDGFIHSMSQGRLGAKSWSLVVDKTGIFYDATQASDLENLIKTTSLTADQRARTRSCIETITNNNITKYNNAPLEIPSTLKQYKNPVLVLDQVEGDMSIPYAMASLASFQDMLNAALAENPNADILIKRHPDVINGKRKGCIKIPQTLPNNVHLITDNINPLALMKHVEKVYVVSSQAGFEALILGKEVICFGAPFYSSWGLTSDRFDNNLPVVKRRNCKPDIYSIFFAAYISYSRYLDPIKNIPCEIETVLTHVKHQHEQYKKNTGQFICVGLTPWKRRFIKHFLKGPSSQVHFIKDTKKAKKLELNQETKLLIWSNKHDATATKISNETGAKIVRVEDGFLRSVNLGSNYTLPSSLVFDEQGIYFDPAKPSDLELILNNTSFSEALKHRAKLLREKIISLGVSKYNLGNQNLSALPDNAKGKKIILVPGQVADDASIKLGCKDINTNLGLLEAVRAASPNAYIIYKPHPDVVSDNRAGAILEINALKYCDQIIEDQSIATCLDFADEVHTLTSLVGFEALMRGLVVHCYGIPFYANWGLTKDRHLLERRHRTLTIDELTAGTLINYPRYFDWATHSFITPENVVDKLYIQSRELMDQKKQAIHSQKLSGYLNLFRALFTPYIK